MSAYLGRVRFVVVGEAKVGGVGVVGGLGGDFYLGEGGGGEEGGCGGDGGGLEEGAAGCLFVLCGCDVLDCLRSADSAAAVTSTYRDRKGGGRAGEGGSEEELGLHG